MTDHDRFEARLEARLLARAAQSDRPFDQAAIAHAAVVRARSTGVLRRPRLLGVGEVGRRPGSRMGVIAVLLVLATVGMVVVAGSGQLTPSPIPVDRGVFIQLGTVAYRHDGYTSTLLKDGRVLIVGGSTSQTQRTAEIWDPRTEAFTPTGLPIMGRYGHAALLLPDDRVLIVGGYEDGSAGPHVTVETWDPASGAFTLGPSLASVDALSAPTMLLADGRVLIGRGSAAEVFDPGAGTLAPAGPLGDVPQEPDGVRLQDGRILLSSLAASQVWDPSTGTFSPTGGLLAWRGGCGLRPQGTSVVLRDGRVLTVGGSRESGHTCPAIDSAEIWDPRTGESTLTVPMPEAMRYSTATLLQDGRVLIVPPDEGQHALLFTFQ